MTCASTANAFGRAPLRMLLTLLTLAYGCTKTNEAPVTTAAKPQAEAAVPAKDRVVNLYIWGDYTSKEVLDEFTRRTGIKVVESNYSSNEELLAKLQAGATGFDLAVPSDYMVSVMGKLGLVQELDKARVPNAKNVDPRFLKKPFDPDNKISLPYAWSITGIAVHRGLYKDPVTSWNAVFDNAAAKGRIAVLDDVREALGAALKLNGASLNATDPKDLGKAQATMLAAKKNIKTFNSMPADLLASDEVMIAQMYSGEALTVGRDSGKSIEFVIPTEGAALSIDNVVLLKDAPHRDEAYALMDYFFDVAAAADFVARTLSGPVVSGVRERLPKEVQANTTLFPSDEILAKCEMMQDLGEQTAAWDRIWSEIKAASH